VLLDVMMPGMNGIETLRALKSATNAFKSSCSTRSNRAASTENRCGEPFSSKLAAPIRLY
jgi:CheY-like chemotaxis protein